MGRATLRSATFWTAAAVLLVIGALALAGLRWHDELPRWPRALVFALSVAAGLLALLGLATMAYVAVSADHDPHAYTRPTGGQLVWFTRLGADGAGEALATEGADLLIGSGPDATVRLDGLAAHHARVRVWPHRVEVSRVTRERVRVGDTALARGAWRSLADGDVLELGPHRLRVNVGWRPDPDDARVGTRLGRHQLVRRLGRTGWGTRYQTRDAILDRLDRQPLDDARLAAYVAASAEAHRACPTVAEVETARDADGTPALVWAATPTDGDPAPSTPEAVLALCERLAPLHQAGQAHGALDADHLLPGTSGPRRAGAVAAAVPLPSADAAETAPYRVPARATGVSPDHGADDADDDPRAPELVAGAAPTPQADVFALATLLRRVLTRTGRRDAAPWAALVRTARADDPASRPADAAALARAILRAAALDRPREPFAGRTFGPCPRCGERLLGEEGPETIMMDGVDRDGRRVGGQTRTWHGECAGCGHRTQRSETQHY